MAREKPIPRHLRKLSNRGRDVSRKDDNVKNFSIGLMDIDATIMYYFNNVIKPKVVENDESVKVPIMYANPERWASVQSKGFLYEKHNYSKFTNQLYVIIFNRMFFRK